MKTKLIAAAILTLCFRMPAYGDHGHHGGNHGYHGSHSYGGYHGGDSYHGGYHGSYGWHYYSDADDVLAYTLAGVTALGFLGAMAIPRPVVVPAPVVVPPDDAYGAGFRQGYAEGAAERSFNCRFYGSCGP
jgi:hypothetical protein